MQRKNIPDPGFAGDDGSADPLLAAALARHAAEPSPETERELVALLAGARLMVPIVAILGEVETDADGLKHDKSSDMAVPTIDAPDGRKGLPAFTSLDAMARWRADARPAPVPARQAVQAAWSEQADALLIDLAGPAFYELSGAAMRAVAEGRAMVDPLRDPEVAEAVRTLLAAHPVVLRAHLLPSTETDALLALVPDPAVDREGLGPAVQRVAEALGADELLRIRLDRGLDLAVVAASPPNPRPPSTPAPPEAAPPGAPGGDPRTPAYRRAGQP
ncbi:SseB family protein [Streptacidiphilus sp. PB12-B1b]|uniref:SseB family protein n=1 Tax=Streptacidiphilus sp. PB12-B1b TaxID=2705012 RepID=UPI0015F909EA|nr:SseB family protein [Streptacidiphilus sp. PB12-B1b]QMU76347.1 SseB family protein [Streptacidiphilus sp. PB12-B1b]